MARKSGRGGTGPKPANQGKMIGPKTSPAVEGTTTGNGSWSGGGKLAGVTKPGPQRGSRKSF